MRLAPRGLAALAGSVALVIGLMVPMAHAQSANVFVFAQSGDPTSLDPALIDDGLSARVTEQIYETLVEFDGATTRLRPALAESWEVSPDGLTWTFHLRQGVTFHDGTPFDSNAVKANFDRWQNQSGDPFHKPSEFIYWSNVVGFDQLIKSTEATDPYTFTVFLNDTSGPFLLNLALFTFAIVSPQALASSVQDLSLNPVGTGPFKFVEWVRGDHVTLATNDSYWGGRPQIDGAIVRTIPDNAARFFELQAGNVDMIEFPNPDDVRVALANPDLQVMYRPSLNVAYVDFNQWQQPFNDVRVRTALAMATNRQGIVDALYGGTGIVAKELLPPGTLGYNAQLTDIPYDPAGAKQMLSDAGFANGLLTDFWYMPVDRPYYPNPQAIAQAICSDWSKVGVTCNIQTKDWTAYKNDIRAHKMSAWMFGWTGDNGDPDNFLFGFFGTPVSRNQPDYNTWDNAVARDLLARAQHSVDDVQRDELYQRVDEIVRSEMPRIPIAHTTPPLPARTWVSGYIPNPTSTEFFKTVVLSR